MINSSYEVISLRKALSLYPEGAVSKMLSGFCCARDKDVESFLREKAVIQEKKQISRTYLIFTSGPDPKLTAYFTIAVSSMDVADLQCSKEIQKKMNVNKGLAQSYLLGQLGKHDGGPKGLGKFALEQATDRIVAANMNVGCRVIRIDCRPSLMRYYEGGGFALARRNKDDDLIQMIRIIGTQTATVSF